MQHIKLRCIAVGHIAVAKIFGGGYAVITVIDVINIYDGFELATLGKRVGFTVESPCLTILFPLCYFALLIFLFPKRLSKSAAAKIPQTTTTAEHNTVVVLSTLESPRKTTVKRIAQAV